MVDITLLGLRRPPYNGARYNTSGKHEMPIGITLTEAKHRPSTDSGSIKSKYIVEEIFDGYTTSELPILLPRPHEEYNTKTTSMLGDGSASITDSEVHEEEMESNLRIDKTKRHFRDFQFYDLQAFESDGTPFDFTALRGKYVLITNIASRCGRQWHMEFLEELSEKYKNDVVVLGFPSNTFLQNWKTAEETKECFMERYQCKFKIMEKVRVNGWGQHKVFKYLKDHKSGFWGIKTVKWNFEKFLVDRDGVIVRRYSTFKHPHAIMKDLDELLKEEEVEAEAGYVKKMNSSQKLRQMVSQGQKVIYV